MENGDIKALVPVICPHCSETLMVEFTTGVNLLEPEAAAEIMRNIKKEDEPDEEA